MKRLQMIGLLVLLGLGLSACDKGGATKDDAEPTEQTTSATEKEGEASGEKDDITERMAKEHEGDKPVANEGSMTEPAQPVTGKEVTYATVDGSEVTGYLSMPEGAEPGSLPAIVVIHEWWGLNDNIRKMTDRLAGEGYAALAVDLYQDKSAQDPAGAKKLMQQAMGRKPMLQKNLSQAIDYLGDEMKAQEIGVIGWCFGGGWSLQTTLMAPDRIDATVMYYGRVDVSKEELAKINSPLIGFFGSEDQGIPVESVKEFRATLEELGKTADINVYQGANHAFANPSGQTYDAKAAEDSWSKATAFLAENLKGEAMKDGGDMEKKGEMKKKGAKKKGGY